MNNEKKSKVMAFLFTHKYKIIAAIAIIYAVVALPYNCGGSKEQPKNDVEKIDTPKVVSFVRNFIDNNPNWKQNDIIRKDANNRFSKGFYEALSKNEEYLSDIPLELKSIHEYKKGKFAANFRLDSLELEKTYGIQINIDVIGCIDKKFISQLQQNKRYYIGGKFLRPIKSYDYKSYITLMVVTYSLDAGLDYDINTKSDIYNLGIVLMDITELKELPIKI